MNTEELLFPEEKLGSYLEKYTKTVVSNFSYLLLLFFALGVLIGYQYQSVILAFVCGGLNVAFFWLAKIIHLQNSSKLQSVRLQKGLAVFVLLVFYVQFTWQVQGDLYMRVMFFVFLSVLILFEDWKSLLLFYLSGSIVDNLHLVLQWSGTPSFLEGFYKQAVYREMDVAFFLLMDVFAFCHFLLSAFAARHLHVNTVKDAGYAMYLEEQLNIEANTELANQITEGVYDKPYELKPYDQMGKALCEMRESMKETQAEQIIREWKISGIQEFNKILINANTINGLGKAITSQLTKFLKAFQSGLYIAETEADSQTLSLVGHFGFNGTAVKQGLKINLGEGLVGECFEKMKVLYLKKVPKSYKPIISGLGESTPAEVLIVPLIFYGKAVGVIEVAHFIPFKEQEVEFVKEIADNIAASINSHGERGKTEKLLTEAQGLNNMLKDQEEEMAQNMEVMAVAQNDLSKMVKDQKERLQFFEKQLLGIQCSPEGNIRYMTDALKHRLEGSVPKVLQDLLQFYEEGSEVETLLEKVLHTGEAVGSAQLKNTANTSKYQVKFTSDAKKQAVWLFLEESIQTVKLRKELADLQQLLTQKEAELQAMKDSKASEA